MRLVVLGAPGAGKGTQARNLAKHFDAPHVSTGDILRDEMRRGTPTGMAIAALMDRGSLVPDAIVVDIIKEYVNKPSFILDGFPRNLYQAKMLDTLCRQFGTRLDAVIYVMVPDAVIVERMSGRVVCPVCGTMHHNIYYPPKIPGVCQCGAALVQREDDKAKTVERRLALYHEITEPIIGFYESQGMLLRFDGTGEVADIADAIVRVLESR